MSTFTSEYFIQKLAPIPAKRFITAHLDSADGASHCTAGWLGGYFSPETLALGKLFLIHFSRQIDSAELLVHLRENPYELVYDVNDSCDPIGIRIKGTNPKERILNMLYKIRRKELQDGNVAIAKQIVSNPKSVSDVTKTPNKQRTRCYANLD